MDKITVKEIVNATGGKLLYGSEENYIEGVCTDSRIAKVGEAFFPIIGEVNDAHKFIPQVYDSGCRTFIVSNEEAAVPYRDCNVIVVDDTTKAIQSLAGYYLDKLNLRKLAVTGSVGKTSTRDMLYFICSQKYKTGRPAKNLNSDIGVPLAIFSFNDTMEACVLELGMDNAGEIHRLANFVRPEAAIITNVGISHIERLGSRENIKKAKMEITDFFDESNTLIINESCDMLNKDELNGPYDVITVGNSGSEDYSVSNVVDLGEKGIEFTLKFQGKNYEVKLDLPGAHNAINASLAIAAASKVGITVPEAIEGLKKIEITGKRLKVVEAGGVKIIDDTYNAAPDSMKSAIMTTINTDGKRKVAILGDMNELGDDSKQYHFDIGVFAGEKGIDFLVAIGPKGKGIADGARSVMGEDKVLYFEEKAQYYDVIKDTIKPGDVVIVKASRGMELEDVVDKIISEQE